MKFKFLPSLGKLNCSTIDHFCKKSQTKKCNDLNASWTTRIQIKTSENISSLTFESNSRPCYDFLDKSSTVLQSAVLHPLMGQTIWFLKNICCTIHCTLMCTDKFSSGKNSSTHLFMKQYETQCEYCCHEKIIRIHDIPYACHYNPLLI